MPAVRTGAEAIHPGYGFLSESAGFADACAARGIVFIGPTPAHLRDFGLKHTARAIAAQGGVPLLPGTELLAGADEAAEQARAIGYPVMLKSTAGGGGIGMRLCRSESELRPAFEAVERVSRASFGTSGLYLEKFVENARHIEVQIFGDGAGEVVALGERDCSAQRRNQKVIEETPAPGLPDAARSALIDAALRLGRAVKYQSAGTVEFIYDNDTGDWYFLEVNTRLQVEHGVTEEVTGHRPGGMDGAAGGAARCRRCTLCRFGRAGVRSRCACMPRIPPRNFSPARDTSLWSSGRRPLAWKRGWNRARKLLRTTTRCWPRSSCTARIAQSALGRMRAALAECRIAGIETNLEYLRQVTADPAFEAGGITTSYLRGFDYRRRAVDVIESGVQTTVQDYPGRLGYWHVGVPPSGPMDDLAFRAANRLVGNDERAAGLEIAVMGPTLRIACDTTIGVTGADFDARLNGAPVPRWQAVEVAAGSLLEFGSAQGAGSRAYLAIAGGIEVPEYLGSKSTFILGRFGGHAGRVLRAGDVLHLGEASGGASDGTGQEARPTEYTNEWEIGVVYGPHGAPDFFTPADIEMFFSTAWKVHYNSDRTGVRLIGPKPTWARKDGGEAGLHPSNIHDNAYAVGTVDFTGDMPVILGPDGPSLGGFVCPATIRHDELWKMGQLRPGDRVRFRRRQSGWNAGDSLLTARLLVWCAGPMATVAAGGIRPQRARPESAASGRTRWSQQLRAAGLPGILDLTPGVRSLQIHYDTRHLDRETLLDALDDCERRIPDLDDISAPSRIVHLPLSWEDPATLLAIRKYMQSVRPDAPWCPSNIEFIRRINGLASIDEVRRIVFDANYLVLGLGDVYLGAPVATPVDPRHRLVTTKYNPARTWTPENAVGIGGAYLCVYGMEGPGGYQFVGRTLQMWNTFHGFAARGCCASSIRSGFTKSARRSCWRFVRTFLTAAIRCASRSRNSGSRIITRFWIPFAARARHSRGGSRRPLRQSVNAGRLRAQISLSLAGERSWRQHAAGCRAGRLPGNLFAGDRQRVEHRGGARRARAGRPEIDGIGSHEDGDRGIGAERRNGRDAELRSGRPGQCGPAPGDATSRGMNMKREIKLDLGSLRGLYKTGAASPADVIAMIYDRIERATTRTGLDFRSAAREGPGARPQARARPGGSRASALRRSLCGQRQYRSGRPADHGGMSRLLVCARTQRLGRPGAGGRRRDPGGQDQHGPVRHGPGGHAFAAWRVFQRVRPALYFGRLQFRIGGGGGFGPGQLRAWHRHGRIGPCARRFQWTGGVETDARRTERAGRGSSMPDIGLRVGLLADLP